MKLQHGEQSQSLANTLAYLMLSGTVPCVDAYVAAGASRKGFLSGSTSLKKKEFLETVD